MRLYFQKLYPESILPTFGHDDFNNAGFDFYSLHDITIAPHGFAIIGTGVAWDGVRATSNFCQPCREKCYIEVRARSGLVFKDNIEGTCAGIIDSGFSGEIKYKVFNKNGLPFVIKKGDRFAQGIFHVVPMFEIVETDTIAETSRGDKGFGSSGK